MILPLEAAAKRLVVGALLACVAACGASAPADDPNDIGRRLARLPGVGFVVEVASPTDGYRYFSLAIAQPSDHGASGGATFWQRLALLHRDEAAPMVLFHTGYHLSTSGRLTEPARLLGANQLAVEHRFFGPSLPANADWSTLTIRQAADDDHGTVTTLRALYGGPWISTGASKGGDTVLFHRRFHPGDVVGTAAYVAPLNDAADLEPTPSNRFVQFLERVGTSECRASLRAFQRLALSRKATLLPKLRDFGRGKGVVFDAILGLERAFEIAVVELPFLFWQYSEPALCAQIPGAEASDDQVFEFLDDTADVYQFSDQDVLNYLAYYHHCATELGYAVDDESPIADLERYPGADRPRTYIPAGYAVGAYRPEALDDVRAWLASSADRVLLVYGENDPWSAGAAVVGGPGEAYRFFAPGQNHGARVSTLVAAERATAEAALRRWAGLPASKPVAVERASPSSLGDALDESLRRRSRGRAQAARLRSTRSAPR